MPRQGGRGNARVRRVRAAVSCAGCSAGRAAAVSGSTPSGEIYVAAGALATSVVFFSSLLCTCSLLFVVTAVFSLFVVFSNDLRDVECSFLFMYTGTYFLVLLSFLLQLFDRRVCIVHQDMPCRVGVGKSIS